MLPNESFALACRAYYDEIGLVVDASNGEFAHSPLTRNECDTGYYLLHGHHQHQGLLQSKDIGKCCFFSGHTRKWLEEPDLFPENYFELWDIYDEYSGDNGRMVMEKLHKEKDENGKSLHALEMNKKLNEEKDDNGKSVNAVKGAEKTHEAKDENGKSLQGLKNSDRLNEEKDENGKSLAAAKGGEKATAQIWESTIDGFRGNAGNVAYHNKARGWDPNARIRVK